MGGSFQTGAVTAAYGYLFNELMHAGSRDEAMRRAGYGATVYYDGPDGTIGTICNPYCWGDAPLQGVYPEAALIPASRAVSISRAVANFFGWGAAPASPNVMFGTSVEGEVHATRWLVDRGSEVSPVKDAIRQALVTNGAAARPVGGNGWSGSVNVGGQNIGYSAYKLPDGTINVGSIRPPR